MCVCVRHARGLPRTQVRGLDFQEALEHLNASLTLDPAGLVFDRVAMPLFRLAARERGASPLVHLNLAVIYASRA